MGVAVKAYLVVVQGRHTQLSFLVHDVYDGIHIPETHIPQQGEHFHIHGFLVVEGRIPLVAVESGFIVFGDLPYQYGNAGAFLLFNREVAARLASFEQKLVVWNGCLSHIHCIGASLNHLGNRQVTAVCKVVFFFHMRFILSEGFTLLPP